MYLPPALPALLGVVALASLLVAVLGLVTARCVGRSAPARHGVLMCALCVLVLLPAAPFAAQQFDIDWLPRWGVMPLITGPDATGSASASSSEFDSTGAAPAPSAGGWLHSTRATQGLHTLTADEIPAGAILPGQATDASPSSGATGSASASAARSTGGSLRSTAATVWSWWHHPQFIVAAIGLWTLGTLVSLVRTLRAATGVARLVRRALAVEERAVTSLLAELSTAMRLRRPPQLRAAARLRVPFAWGLLSPVIVVPQRLIESPDVVRLKPILLHELAHVRRGDVWIGLLQRFVAAAYWWNPLVHLLNSRLADAREELCDAHVIAGGCSSRDYAEILVELAAHLALPQPAAAPGLLSRSEPQLTRRVQHLLEDQPMATALRAFGRVALLGLFAVLATTALLLAYVLVDNVYRERMHPLTTYDAVPFPNWARGANGGSVVQVQPQRATPQPVSAAPVQPAVEAFVALDEVRPSSGGSKPMSPMLDGDALLAQQPQPGDPFGTPGTFDSSEPLPAGDEPFGATIAPDSTFTFAPPGDPASAESGAGGAAQRGFGMAYPVPADPNLPQPDPEVHFTTDGAIRGLAVIELVGNDDGSIRELRWFTESLGAGDEAFTKLTERLTEFARPRAGVAYRLEQVQTSGMPAYRLAPLSGTDANVGRTEVGPVTGAVPSMVAVRVRSGSGTPADVRTLLSAQITASPQLRYEHVARVVELCEADVQRVLIVQSASLKPELTLTLGFVRDGSGKQISSSPVLIWNDAIVPEPVFMAASPTNRPYHQPGVLLETPPKLSPPHDEIVDVRTLAPRLLTWRHTLSGDVRPAYLTARIRADAGVDPKLVEQVVQATLPAGVERVILEPLGAQQTVYVVGTVTEIDNVNGQSRATISIGADDGVQMGSKLRSKGKVIAAGTDIDPNLEERYIDVTLTVIALEGDKSVCMLAADGPSPEVGAPAVLEVQRPLEAPATGTGTASPPNAPLPTS